MEWYKRLVFYFSIAFIVFAIISKIWLVYNLPLGFNEGGYGLVANGILDGKDVFDHKPPFLHYLLAFVLDLFGRNALAIHYLALVLDLSLAITIFFVAKHYFGKEKGAIACAIYMALSFIDGLYLDTEIPSVLFGLIGSLFYIKALNGRKMFYFLSGIFIAFSIWFKQPAVLFFIAIVIHQSILRYRKEIDSKSLINNLLLCLLGILIISIPLLSFFLWKEGSDFIFKIVTFNLLFKGSTSRILASGKSVFLIASITGLLFVPLFNSKTKHKEEFLFLSIIIFLWTLFFLASQEIFYNHLFHFIPFLILAFMFSIENYSLGENKLIYALIILIILIPMMTHLDDIARDVRAGTYTRSNEINTYLNDKIPNNASVFSDNPVYQFAIGKPSLYKIPGLAPSFVSVFNVSDFCAFSDRLDYLILTARQNRLPDDTLKCTLKKFTLVKRFDNVRDSFVELWKKN